MQPNDTLSDDIRELNLSFLLLAQNLIRTDKAQALYRLGISEAVCDVISALSPQQLVRVASRNLMLCAMRFNDDIVWGLLTDRHAPRQGEDSVAARLHASVLMAGRSVAA